METLRFLLVTTFYPPYHIGGDAIHVRYLAEALAARGHEVHVEFAPEAYRLKQGGTIPSSDTDKEPIHLHPISSRWGRMQPVAAYLLGQSRSVARHHSRLLKEVKPNVVHWHNISLLGLGVLRRDGANKTLYTAHDYWVECPRNDLFKYGRYPCDAPTCIRCSIATRRPPQVWRYWDEWRALRGLDFVIAPSEFMKRTIERRFTCPVVHVPNFAPDENPQGSLWEPGDYYLFVGVHEAHKGILELASATAIQRSGHSIMFVGLGRYERRLRTMERDSPSKMEIRGWAGPEVLSRLYRRARGLIVPSLAHENSPLAAIEALSWGTPLLVSNRGGLEELIRGGDAGVSFEPDASEIATAIMSFEDSGFPHKLREKARWTYETHHHPRKYLERYMALTEVEGKSYQQEVSQEAARSGLHSHEMASYQGVGPD